MNASLQPHLTPSCGRPSGDWASGRPVASQRDRRRVARRAAGASTARRRSRRDASALRSACATRASRCRGDARRRPSASTRAPVSRAACASNDQRRIDRGVERRRRVREVLERRTVRLGVEQSAHAAAGERAPQLHGQQQSAVRPAGASSSHRSLDEQRRDVDLRRESAAGAGGAAPGSHAAARATS